VPKLYEILWKLITMNDDQLIPVTIQSRTK